MAEASSGFPGQQLSIEGIFPFEWRIPGDRAAMHAGSSFHHQNEKALRQVIELDEFTADLKEEALSTRETARLEKKLNLVIEMLGVLVNTYRETTEAVPLKIYSLGLEWIEQGTHIPAEGDEVEARIFLHAYSPSPVIFPGRIQAVSREATGNRCRLEFHEISEPVRDLLEKLIFLHHRRSVASRKAGAD